MKHSSAVSAALVLSFGTGCLGVKEPSLRVVEARLADRTDEAIVVHFVVEGENVNEKELPLLTADYRVTMNGREVFSATRSPEATLRRKGVQRFVLPASIPAAQAPAGPVRWSVSGSVGYIVPERIAETLLDIGLPNPTAAVRGEGQIELAREG